MAVTLPDARQLSDEVLEALRLRALRGCEMDLTEAEIAEILGVSRETGSPRILRKRPVMVYNDTGLEAMGFPACIQNGGRTS